MAGPTILPGGDVVSSALSMDELPRAGGEMFENFRMEVGQIEKIYTIDEKDNASTKASANATVYDVLVRRASGVTERILRCRMLQPTFGGGMNNFLEVLPTDPGFD